MRIIFLKKAFPSSLALNVLQKRKIKKIVLCLLLFMFLIYTNIYIPNIYIYTYIYIHIYIHIYIYIYIYIYNIYGGFMQIFHTIKCKFTSLNVEIELPTWDINVNILLWSVLNPVLFLNWPSACTLSKKNSVSSFGFNYDK